MYELIYLDFTYTLLKIYILVCIVSAYIYSAIRDKNLISQYMCHVM